MRVDVPRFFFDTDDGRTRFRDETGVELAKIDDVPDEAFGLLRDLTHQACAPGRSVVTASVRDPSGSVIFRASMTIVSDWNPS